MTYCFITLELWNNGNPIKKNKVIKGSLIEYSEWLTIQHNLNYASLPIFPLLGEQVIFCQLLLFKKLTE